MQFLKNKHVILAMFVAPILAIIAYFGVDYVVSEKPHSAQKGNSYRLSANSNCRYKSGHCTLVNGDIEVHLRAQRSGEQQIELSLSSDIPIQNALISYVDDNIASEPTPMHSSHPQTNTWLAKLNLQSPEKSTLRLALGISDSLYYAETSAVFIDYQTSFSQDNFSQ
ncbi:MAG: hypothetical protein OQL06_08765 [Gammaproteobacteria bacterium]|nr:hypothetical protein [Gammaproteobacteria bacterium]